MKILIFDFIFSFTLFRNTLFRYIYFILNLVIFYQLQYFIHLKTQYI
jgi:hypothetical protein